MSLISKKTILILLFSYIRCAVYNLFDKVCPGSENNRLFFDFDDNFNNFRSNITEDILNHESLFKQPFGFCEPLGNFLNTFCLFYRNSQIKHNKEFRVILKNLFESCQDKKLRSDHVAPNFQKYLEQENDRIKKILEEKDISKQLVLIEEKKWPYCL